MVPRVLWARPYVGRAFRFQGMTDQQLERVDRTYRRVGRRWAWNIVSFAGFLGWEPVLRRRTVERLELKQGEAVLDVACGRGSNFPYLQRAVGETGRIVGIDYSAAMLAGAEELVRKRAWVNVELVQGDAAAMQYEGEFDAALCTIALSVIPSWRETLRGMVAAVRPGGHIAVMDGRLGTGVRRLQNPYGRLFARVVAADPDRDIRGEYRKLIADAREETLMFGGYYILSGRARSPTE